MITSLLGLPPTWGSFVAGLNSWKESPTFEEIWNACSEEVSRISLAFNYEWVSNTYISQHKGNKSKVTRKKVDISKVECYQCDKKGHYKNDCPDNLRHKKRERYQAKIVEEGDPNKFKPR